ncbi:phosphoenolpyruvate carboxykinase (ATP) [bacterium]|nr:phosphoenolpyruvate carboxykinase (ATP) [bacterium]
MTGESIVIEQESSTTLHWKQGEKKVPEREDACRTINKHPRSIINPDREFIIRQVIRRREAILGKQGYLYTTTPTESSGRSPRDTYIVRDSATEKNVDWSSPNNHALEKETFQRLWNDALNCLSRQEKLFITDRAIGADPTYALSVRIVSDSALTSLFTLNMFRPVSTDFGQNALAGKQFLLLVLPHHKIESSKYQGRLRLLPSGKTSDMAIAMDFENRLGLVYGSAYGGSVKKLMFTVMNYYLPFINVLPFHCSASENEKGETALFLGLSGTGKTSLSADPKRSLLGDDEHGWSETGIANFENGCYAKLINLNPSKEPEIFRAVFHKDHCLKHGAIVENAMIFPDGTFDLSDDRLTPNSRASFPLSFLRNIKESSRGHHPKTIIFLTADANSVLPPISKLDKYQAMLWFLMGYTSKLAGTETGIIDPVSIFSRFFGEPFMPLLPHYYARLLGDKLDQHPTSIFLLNTGWAGGPYGIGKRMDINLTKHLLYAALNGDLEHIPVTVDTLFHLQIPKNCPGIPAAFLNPNGSWTDKKAYERRALQLAMEFSKHFDKSYGNSGISREVRCQCPGK